MPVLSLFLLLVFLAIIFPVRSLLRKARFGDTGRAGLLRPRPRSWWLADLLFVTGFALVVAGPALAIAGVAAQFFELGGPAWVPVLALVLLATALAIWSQETMGAAWQTDIAPGQDSSLVTTGPFRLVRNPNYLAMLLAAAGSTILAPTWIGILGLALLTAGLVLTARVEESQLAGSYGRPYLTYAAQTGRFVPGVGLISRRKPVNDTTAAPKEP